MGINYFPKIYLLLWGNQWCCYGETNDAEVAAWWYNKNHLVDQSYKWPLPHKSVGSRDKFSGLGRCRIFQTELVVRIMVKIFTGRYFRRRHHQNIRITIFPPHELDRIFWATLQILIWEDIILRGIFISDVLVTLGIVWPEILLNEDERNPNVPEIGQLFLQTTCPSVPLSLVADSPESPTAAVSRERNHQMPTSEQAQQLGFVLGKHGTIKSSSGIMFFSGIKKLFGIAGGINLDFLVATPFNTGLINHDFRVATPFNFKLKRYNVLRGVTASGPQYP